MSIGGGFIHSGLWRTFRRHLKSVRNMTLLGTEIRIR